MSGYFRAYSIQVREASRDLDERQLRVWLALLSYANCEGMCWPGIKTLVEVTGLHTEAVLSALDELVGRTYVEVLRKGTRDAFTHSMLPNVYRITGAVIDDDCAGDEFRTDDPILTSREELESQQQQRTDSIKQPEETKPETTTTTTPDSFEVEEGKPKTKTGGKRKTTERSSIPKPPNPVPPTPSPTFYSGSLSDYAKELPEEQEAAAQLIYVELRHQMPIRNARKLIVDFGTVRVRLAMNFLNRQSNVTNPPGLLRHLLEKQSIESRDGEAVNPGDEYITGEYADYIEH